MKQYLRKTVITTVITCQYTVQNVVINHNYQCYDIEIMTIFKSGTVVGLAWLGLACNSLPSEWQNPVNSLLKYLAQPTGPV